MRLLRTLRVDATDERVFERAAASGEWAVPGGFAFAGETDEAGLTGKRRQAFRSGFLGLDSFGWSTFAVVVDADGDGLADKLAATLARHFVESYGAPDLEAALPAARDEIAFAASVADQPVGTVLRVERELTGDGVREAFRAVERPRGDPMRHAAAWE
ncbi:MAG TPA: DUF6505 family protein, partial [Geminicoccaceae bacterium]